MAGKKLTELPTIGEITGAELIYVVDNFGVSRQADIQEVAELVESNVTEGALLKTNNLSDIPNVPLAKDNLDLGTLADQDADAVDIIGGTLDGVDIGLLVPSDAVFEDLTVTGTVNLPVGSIDSSALTDNFINVNYDNGLQGDSTVILGGSLNISLPAVDGGDF